MPLPTYDDLMRGSISVAIQGNSLLTLNGILKYVSEKGFGKEVI